MSPSPTYPEPVPAATQLAIMPFLAAVQGSLLRAGEVPKLRITVHRAMSREGRGYLQQACGYFPVKDPAEWKRTVGRIFPVSTGIMGRAYTDGRIWRTKFFKTEEELVDKLAKSMALAKDSRSPKDVGKSWLAMPFRGPLREVVLILYAECDQFNFFADNERIRELTELCGGFCRLFDALQKSPFPTLQNFALEPGQPVIESPSVYELIQEAVDEIPPPYFELVSSFNFEASVA